MKVEYLAFCSCTGRFDGQSSSCPKHLLPAGGMGKEQERLPCCPDAAGACHLCLSEIVYQVSRARAMMQVEVAGLCSCAREATLPTSSSWLVPAVGVDMKQEMPLSSPDAAALTFVCRWFILSVPWQSLRQATTAEAIMQMMLLSAAASGETPTNLAPGHSAASIQRGPGAREATLLSGCS